MDKDQSRFSVWNEDLKFLTCKQNHVIVVPYRSTNIFNPESKFFDYWSKFMTVVLMYTAFVTPYRVAFIDVDNLPWSVVEYVFSVIFFTDFLINCNLAYYDTTKNLVFDRKKILTNYLIGWMIPDFFASLPFNAILEQNKQLNSLVRVARLPRLYRLFKIAKLFRIIKVMKHSRHILKHVNMFLKISMAFERIFWFVFTYLVLVHLVTCMWAFVAVIENSSVNWISVWGFEDLGNEELYIVSLYWTVTTVATVGYGDVVATNLAEKIFSIVVMTLGIIFYSFSVSSLTNVLSSIDSRQAKLKNQLMTLDQIHKEYCLNKSFHLQLTRALEFINKKSPGIEEFVKDLPGTLGNNVLIVAYEKILSENVFFENKSTDFVAWVAPRLKFCRIERNEVIYTEEEYATQMYFITHGAVEFVLHRNMRIIPYYELESKYFFGEIDLLFSEDKKHIHATQARDPSEVLTLSKDNFYQLLNTFEVEAIEICGKAKERLERINEKLQDTEQRIKNNDYSIVKRKTYPQFSELMYFDKIRKSLQTNDSQDLDKKHSPNLFKKIVESKSRIRYHNGRDIRNKAEELEKEANRLKEILESVQNKICEVYHKYVKEMPKFSPDTSSNESYLSSNEGEGHVY